MARKRLISKKRPPYFHKPIGLKRAQFKRLRPPRDFTLRKRGLRRPVEDDLERRAVSKERVIGTLPERIIYKELLRRRITFDFQSSLLGGRQKLGGMVADYILYLPLGTIILRIQTQYFHTTHEAKLKDDEQRAVLESLRDPISGKYFIVYDVWDYIVYDADRLNDWLNRVLSPKAHTFYLGGPGRGVWMPSRAEWEALVGQVRFLMETNAGQEAQIEDLLRRLSGATLSDITHGSLGLVTAGEFRAGDGKVPDVDFTGTRMYYDPANRTGAIEGQASGTKQFYLDTDGKAYAGAGAVTLDASGVAITIDSEAGLADPNKILWKLAGNTVSEIYTSYNAAGDLSGYLALVVDAGAVGGSRDGAIAFVAIASDDTLAQMTLEADEDGNAKYLVLDSNTTFRFNDANTEIWEDGSSNLSFKDANAGTIVLRRLKGVEFKTNPERALTLANQSAVDWTDLDLTAYTSANARGAILQLSVMDSGGANGEFRVRENGSGGAAYVPVARTQVAGIWIHSPAIVGCDAGQIIEYKISATGAGTANAWIDVLGYWE